MTPHPGARTRSAPDVKASVFTSHSSNDKQFATAVADGLRASELAPWIDKERIHVGTNILDELGRGLTTMDLFVFIVSGAAVDSGWVKKEIEFAAYREIMERKVLILPFIIDETKVTDLPWHVQSRNVATITADQSGVESIVDAVRHNLEQREVPTSQAGASRFKRVPEVETLIKGRKLGDWDAAEESALKVLAHTDANGQNPLFEAILTYRDAEEQETVINALATAEMCVAIAPWIIDRANIFKLARHPDFTVRSSAASMCMEMARVTPGLVPVDILQRLSRHDEDWYVQAPANAALKTIAHAIPGALRIFFDRLRSENRDEREHAASQLFSVSNTEPEILDKGALESALSELTKRKDRTARQIVAKTVANVRSSRRKPKYKYGL